MRFWLKDSERRPDPAPVQTDDRKPMLIGTAVWLVALVSLLFGLGGVIGAGDPGLVWTCIAGIALGLLGLFYTHRRRV